MPSRFDRLELPRPGKLFCFDGGHLNGPATSRRTPQPFQSSGLTALLVFSGLLFVVLLNFFRRCRLRPDPIKRVRIQPVET